MSICSGVVRPAGALLTVETSVMVSSLPRVSTDIVRALEDLKLPRTDTGEVAVMGQGNLGDPGPHRDAPLDIAVEPPVQGSGHEGVLGTRTPITGTGMMAKVLSPSAFDR